MAATKTNTATNMADFLLGKICLPSMGDYFYTHLYNYHFKMANIITLLDTCIFKFAKTSIVHRTVNVIGSHLFCVLYCTLVTQKVFT